MIHDPALLDRLGRLPVERLDGEAYRVTGAMADPTAPSTSGGRWAPPGISVLYTSLLRDGAIAEVASYLVDLTPLPRKPLRVHRLEVSVERSLRLAWGTLEGLGVDPQRYGERDYAVTQRIGAAMSFLELDGLISPSARWPCENLTIFGESQALDQKLKAVGGETIDWQAWARSNGFL